MRKPVTAASILIAACVALEGSSTSSVAQQRITLVNAASLPPAMVETIRTYADRELHVPFVVTTAKTIVATDLKAAGNDALPTKTATDAALIVLVTAAPSVTAHVFALTNENVAVVNVSALKIDDELKYSRRVQRQVMRCASVLFGLRTDPDLHSVMHSYQTLDELDKMGNNLSLPWLVKFMESAKKRGLEVRPLVPPRDARPKKVVAPVVAPVSTNK